MYSHIENCYLSKQSQRVYCQEHGLAYSTFQYWAKKYRKGHISNANPDTAPGFIAVRVQPDPQVFPSLENHTTISLQKYTTLMQG